MKKLNKTGVKLGWFYLAVFSCYVSGWTVMIPMDGKSQWVSKQEFSALNPLTTGADYISFYIFTSTLNTNFWTC